MIAATKTILKFGKIFVLRDFHTAYHNCFTVLSVLFVFCIIFLFVKQHRGHFESVDSFDEWGCDYCKANLSFWKDWIGLISIFCSFEMFDDELRCCDHECFKDFEGFTQVWFILVLLERNFPKFWHWWVYLFCFWEKQIILILPFSFKCKQWKCSHWQKYTKIQTLWYKHIPLNW